MKSQISAAMPALVAGICILMAFSTGNLNRRTAHPVGGAFSAAEVRAR
jgi:hypothetical protein